MLFLYLQMTKHKQQLGSRVESLIKLHSWCRQVFIISQNIVKIEGALSTLLRIQKCTKVNQYEI